MRWKRKYFFVPKGASYYSTCTCTCTLADNECVRHRFAKCIGPAFELSYSRGRPLRWTRNEFTTIVRNDCLEWFIATYAYIAHTEYITRLPSIFHAYPSQKCFICSGCGRLSKENHATRFSAFSRFQSSPSLYRSIKFTSEALVSSLLSRSARTYSEERSGVSLIGVIERALDRK